MGTQFFNNFTEKEYILCSKVDRGSRQCLHSLKLQGKEQGFCWFLVLWKMIGF